MVSHIALYVSYLLSDDIYSGHKLSVSQVFVYVCGIQLHVLLLVVF